MYRPICHCEQFLHQTADVRHMDDSMNAIVVGTSEQFVYDAGAWQPKVGRIIRFLALPPRRALDTFAR